MGKLKGSELLEKKSAELKAQLGDLKQELTQLRVAQVTAGAASKLAKIKVVRKNIARVLTAINTKAKMGFRKEVASMKASQIPKQLRAKKTRALRRALSSDDKNKKTERAAKKAQNFPLRRFAVKA